MQLWRIHCAAASGAGLQGYIACGYPNYTALLWTAQGCRVTLPAAVATTLRCCGWRRAAGLHCLRLRRLHCAAVGGVGLGCRATLPAAMANSLCCFERRRAAELHCLRLWREDTELLWAVQGRRAAAGQCLRQWRVQCVLSGGAGPQGCIACGCGEFTAAASGEGLQSFMACRYSDYSRAAEHAIDVDSILRGVVLFYSVGAEGGLRRLPEADAIGSAQMGGPGSPSLFGSCLIRQLLDLGGGSGSLLAVSPFY